MNRILAIVIVIGLVVAAIAIVATGALPRLADPADAPPAAGEAPQAGAEASVPRPADAVAMRVDEITDGDTLRLVLDEPPGELVDASWPIAVRLIGIDTPEVYPERECFGDEAEHELARLAPLGSRVWVAPDADSWDDYDRRLFYLWNAEGDFVNHALVAGGFAEAIRVAPNDAHYALLLEAEAEAASAGRGMWGACPGR